MPKNGRLFLGSDGDETQSRPLDMLFAEAVGTGWLLDIPIAMRFAGIPFSNRWTWFTSVLSRLVATISRCGPT